MINKAIVEGRVGQAAELRTTPQGRMVANVRVITERHWNSPDGTPLSASDWHTIVAWEGLAEQLKGLREGDLVHVEGRLQTRSWEDREHASIKHYRTEIIANLIQLVDADLPDEEAELEPAL